MGNPVSIFELMQTNTNLIFDFLLVFLLVCAMNICLYFFIHRKFVIFLVGGLSIGYLFCYIFLLNTTSYILLGLIFVIILFALFVNMAEARHMFANNSLNNKIPPKKTPEVEKIFNHETLYKTINETVLYLSKNKIGGLITFERKDKLVEIIKNGTYLNAPVTFELLITIFYPGTRLHDGAVVIKDDKIVSASVYYTPTTKPLTGKYGSRHRAAIGISEISDAVTVVVSEETGRISIAYNGTIENYSPDDFYKAFENIMNETDLGGANNE